MSCNGMPRPPAALRLGDHLPADFVLTHPVRVVHLARWTGAMTRVVGVARIPNRNKLHRELVATASKRLNDRAKGSYEIRFDGQKVLIRVDFDVRKSGVSGTGRDMWDFEC